MTESTEDLCRHGIDLLEEREHHDGTDEAERDEDTPVVHKGHAVPEE